MKTIAAQIQSAIEGQVVRDNGEKQSVKGLHLRVRNGRKTFYLYYQARNGAKRWPKVGDYGPMTLAQARGVAKAILDRVVKGEDPQGQWATARAEMTVQELYEKLLSEYWDKPRFRNSGWLRVVKSMYQCNIAPTFGSQRLSEIRRPDVIAWHSQFSAMPSSGNRSLEVLTRMFTKAEEAEIVPRNTSPCWRVKSLTETKRKRYASPQEIIALMKILEREKTRNPYSVAFIYLILFTGTRPSALSRATPEQLTRHAQDGEVYGTLSFQGKTSAESGEEEVVVIPPIAMKILDNLPAPSDGTLLGIKNPKRFWQSVRKEVGCEDLWLRDLRRTFATMGLSGGVNKDVIGKLLNHTLPQTTDLYAKLQLESRMTATKTIADYIVGLKNVVAIR